MDFYELRSNPVLLKEAKMRGFSDRQIAALVSIPEKILVECTLAKMDLLVGLSCFFKICSRVLHIPGGCLGCLNHQ